MARVNRITRYVSTIPGHSMDVGEYLMAKSCRIEIRRRRNLLFRNHLRFAYMLDREVRLL
jgi:hypothetical protein